MYIGGGRKGSIPFFLLAGGWRASSFLGLPLVCCGFVQRINFARNSGKERKIVANAFDMDGSRVENTLSLCCLVYAKDLSKRINNTCAPGMSRTERMDVQKKNNEKKTHYTEKVLPSFWLLPAAPLLSSLSTLRNIIYILNIFVPCRPRTPTLRNPPNHSIDISNLLAIPNIASFLAFTRLTLPKVTQEIILCGSQRSSEPLPFIEAPGIIASSPGIRPLGCRTRNSNIFLHKSNRELTFRRFRIATLLLFAYSAKQITRNGRTSKFVFLFTREIVRHIVATFILREDIAHSESM